MRWMLTMLLGLLISCVASAQCPKVFLTGLQIANEAPDLRITVIAPTDSVDLKKGERISLLYQNGRHQTARIGQLQMAVSDAELGLSEYVLKTHSPRLGEITEPLVALLSQGSGRTAKAMTPLPRISPKVMKGPRQMDSDEFALDTDGDGVADLTFQKFCVNQKCSGDYVLGELHAWQKNQRAWKFCVAQEPL